MNFMKGQNSTDTRLIDDERVRLQSGAEKRDRDGMAGLFSAFWRIKSLIKDLNIHELRELLSDIANELEKRTKV